MRNVSVVQQFTSIYLGNPSTVGDTTMKEINVLFEQALALEAEGKYEAAEPIFVRALTMKEAAMGPDHQELATDYYNAGLLFFVQEKYEQAEHYLMRSLRIDERKLGADHPELLCTLEHIAEVQFNQGAYEKAEKYYRRYLDLHAKTRGQQGAEIVANLHNLAEIYDLLGKPSKANDLRTEAQRLLSDELTSAVAKAS